MKEKIILALKTKYSNLGFSQKALDGVASFLEKTVTDESQIETAVGGVEPILKVFQAETDKMRGENSTLKNQVEEYKKKIESSSATGGEQGNQNEPERIDVEAIKADLLKTLREEQNTATLQAQQAAQRAADIASKAKEYGIPEKFATKLTIDKDADLDEVFKGVKQDLADAGFEYSEAPAQGGGVTSDGSDIAKLIDKGTESIVKSSKTE